MFFTLRPRSCCATTKANHAQLIALKATMGPRVQEWTVEQDNIVKALPVVMYACASTWMISLRSSILIVGLTSTKKGPPVCCPSAATSAPYSLSSCCIAQTFCISDWLILQGSKRISCKQKTYQVTDNLKIDCGKILVFVARRYKACTILVKIQVFQTV